MGALCEMLRRVYTNRTDVRSCLEYAPPPTPLPNQKRNDPSASTAARRRLSRASLRSATRESRWCPFGWCCASSVAMGAAFSAEKVTDPHFMSTSR